MVNGRTGGGGSGGSGGSGRSRRSGRERSTIDESFLKRRATRRRAFAITVIAVWAGVLAWHVKREYFRPFSVRLAEASADLSPATSYYTIRLGDSPIGYAASRIDTTSDGFILDDDMRLRVTALGHDVRATARTTVRLGDRLNLKGFVFTLQSDLGEFRVEGTMGADSVLDLTIVAGGDEQRMAMPTGGPILLPQVMPLHLVLGGEPKPGASYAFEVFDPSTLDRRRVTAEVIERVTLIYPDSADYDKDTGKWVPLRYDTVETWHIRQRFGGVEIDSWLDPDGQIVRASSPLGYTIERTAFEIAWNAYRALDLVDRQAGVSAPDIIEGTAISVGVELPRGAQLRRLAVRLLNVDLAGFDLHGARQQLRGDTLFVEGGMSGTKPDYQLPADPSEWERALASTPLVQSDDAEIKRRANEIASGSNDPVIVAERLANWVYRSLDKEITLSVPSAVQVLKLRRGDCNEHTVLYVALARAAGLPARTAAGLVHVRGRFYFHAWPEVWLGEWVPVDPTLGQFPADASHLRFVTGGLARQVELVRLIGLLELDILAAEES